MATANPTSPSVVTFLSAKGGAGKTVVAAGMATLAGRAGLNVLLVDCDAATNGLTLLFLNEVLDARDAKQQPSLGIFDFDDREDDLGSPDTVEVAPGVNLLPATYAMIDTEQVDSSAFRTKLQQVVTLGSWDLIILDAQAGTDAIARTTAGLATSIVILSEYDPISAEGIERLRRIFAEEMESKAWVLFNKVLPEYAKQIGDFLQIVRYLPPIPWTPAVVLAFARRQLAVDEAGNAYTLALIEVMRKILSRRQLTKIDEWIDISALGLRQSVAERINSLQHEMSRYDTVIASARPTVDSWPLSLLYSLRALLLRSYYTERALSVFGFIAIVFGLTGLSFFAFSSLGGFRYVFVFAGELVFFAGLAISFSLRLGRGESSELSLVRSAQARLSSLQREINELQILQGADFDTLYTNEKAQELHSAFRARMSVEEDN